MNKDYEVFESVVQHLIKNFSNDFKKDFSTAKDEVKFEFSNLTNDLDQKVDKLIRHNPELAAKIYYRLDKHRDLFTHSESDSDDDHSKEKYRALAVSDYLDDMYYKLLKKKEVKEKELLEKSSSTENVKEWMSLIDELKELGTHLLVVEDANNCFADNDFNVSLLLTYLCKKSGDKGIKEEQRKYYSRLNETVYQISR